MKSKVLTIRVREPILAGLKALAAFRGMNRARLAAALVDAGVTGDPDLQRAMEAATRREHERRERVARYRAEQGASS
jgi:hypothetical protein